MALLKEEATLVQTGVHGPGDWKQTKVIIASGQAAAMVRGEVIQQDATSFKFETFDNTAPTGASAILLEDIDATGGSDVTATVMLSGSYVMADLTWPAAITAAQKNAAVAAMRGFGLIPVNSFPLYS